HRRDHVRCRIVLLCVAAGADRARCPRLTDEPARMTRRGQSLADWIQGRCNAVADLQLRNPLASSGRTVNRPPEELRSEVSPMLRRTLGAVSATAMILSLTAGIVLAGNPAGTGQPGAECGGEGATTMPNGFNSGGF